MQKRKTLQCKVNGNLCIEDGVGNAHRQVGWYLLDDYEVRVLAHQQDVEIYGDVQRCEKRLSLHSRSTTQRLKTSGLEKAQVD